MVALEAIKDEPPLPELEAVYASHSTMNADWKKGY